MSTAARVLVTGAGGQVGLDLADVLRGDTPPGGDPGFQPDDRPVDGDEFAVLALTHHDLDVGDAEAARRAVAVAQPDVIVHLAAYTAVDRAEGDAGECFRVNAGGTATLSEAAREFGAHLIAVSTDYVFDGEKGSAYDEDDAPDPLNVYGASKLAGERACRPEDTIVRTSWVMGVRGRTVVKVIARRARSGETVRFVTDQTGTVTLAADLARALATLVRERPGGLWHVANPPATTWFDVAHFVGARLGRPDGFALPIVTAELSPAPAARRPRRSDLATGRWTSRGWRALPDWRDGVARLLGALEEAP
ncbi:MAG: dTDP-4-dehydrorhamnose reductase [Acidimicrobiales bacterium]